jgi:hypothetical protein
LTSARQPPEDLAREHACISVRDAVRSGEETGEDLASGAAWSALLESLRRAGAVVLSDRVPQNPIDTAAGFRHLLVLLHIAIEEIVRGGGTPDIKPANTDNAITSASRPTPACPRPRTSCSTR